MRSNDLGTGEIVRALNGALRILRVREDASLSAAESRDEIDLTVHPATSKIHSRSIQ